MSEPVQFMSQMTAVEYKLPETSLLARRIAESIAEGRIIGHKCPECSRVYVPPRGYCPLCSIPTGEADLVDIEPRGTITTFSVITPLQYQGQEEKDDYVQATILLDGSTSTLGMQRIEGVDRGRAHRHARRGDVARRVRAQAVGRFGRAQPRARRGDLGLEADRRTRRPTRAVRRLHRVKDTGERSAGPEGPNDSNV